MRVTFHKTSIIFVLFLKSSIIIFHFLAIYGILVIICIYWRHDIQENDIQLIGAMRNCTEHYINKAALIINDTRLGDIMLIVVFLLLCRVSLS
jgi:hypothetical protein